MITKVAKLLHVDTTIHQMEKHHYCNFAVDQVLPSEVYEEVFYSYEDNNLVYQPRAESMLGFIEALRPGEFVCITTGDYIHSALPPGAYDWQYETYDAKYRWLCLPQAVFLQYKSELDRVDQEWRRERQALANRRREKQALANRQRAWEL